ncbi:MAG: hypothetical protein ACYSWZ_06265 [Planctomycetota bacterium]|jgi:hypothetical protein
MTNNNHFSPASEKGHFNGLYSFAFSLTSYGISNTEEQVRKNKLFMQNKAKFQKVKLNVNKVLTKDYDQMDTWSIRTTKPIKANLSQSKPIYPVVASGEAGLKPILCQNKSKTLNI